MTTRRELTRDPARQPQSVDAGQARAMTERRQTVAPPVDIFENDDEILLVADLPGVANEDVKIRYDRGELSLEALRHEKTEGRTLSMGYAAHDYARRFQVPGGIDAAKIDAQLKNGVLFLHLPKAETHKPRQIAVRSR